MAASHWAISRRDLPNIATPPGNVKEKITIQTTDHCGLYNRRQETCQIRAVIEEILRPEIAYPLGKSGNIAQGKSVA